MEAFTKAIEEATATSAPDYEGLRSAAASFASFAVNNLRGECLALALDASKAVANFCNYFDGAAP